MELFNKFTDTIIYKKDSDLEKQIEVLRKINEKYPKNLEISKRLKFCELGLKGENEIEFELKNSNLGMYVLHDVLIKYEDLTAQIDYIVITKGRNYFIECKNLIGNITVNNRGEFIREYELNGKKIKEGFYSPVTQAKRHIEVFKKLWNSRNNSIIAKLLYSKNLDFWNKPLVVMANSKNILNVKYAPEEVKDMIIKSDSLVEYIKKDISKIDKDLLSNKKTMEELAKNILEFYNTENKKDYELEFKKLISNEKEFENNNNLDDKAKERLIEFRKKTSYSKKVPAYYIFNNEELENILKLMPKSFEELKKANILPQVKLKIYGEEIVKLINLK